MDAEKQHVAYRVYVAGPCTSESVVERNANIRRADQAGRDLLAAGFTPFVPHTMSRNWEYDPRFQHDPDALGYSDFLRMDLEWLELCDALLFLGASPGADIERLTAIGHGLPVFETVAEVVEWTVRMTEIIREAFGDRETLEDLEASDDPA